MHDVVIIGTGPAGLTAAIYTARAGLKSVIYAGLQHGGQLTTTTVIENYPGFIEGIDGNKLMENFTAQAEKMGTKVIYEQITKVDFSTSPFKLWSQDKEIQAKAVIISTGATAKTLHIPEEDKLMGRGISTCATCDGFFYRNKKVVVVGGGDSAMEESLYLANLCEEVILVHRRDLFRASQVMLERAKKQEKIKFLIPYTISRPIFDKTGLTGLVIKNTATNQESDLQVDGLFYAIGHTPNSSIFAPYVDLDENGYIKVKNYTETKTPGVFAAGDVADHVFRQAITAAGLGCQAGMQAARYLEHQSL